MSGNCLEYIDLRCKRSEGLEWPNGRSGCKGRCSLTVLTSYSSVLLRLISFLMQGPNPKSTLSVFYNFRVEAFSLVAIGTIPDRCLVGSEFGDLQIETPSIISTKNLMARSLGRQWPMLRLRQIDGECIEKGCN